jgi:hypothetical protein
MISMADENKKTFDRMEMIRKKRIKQAVFYFYMHFFSFMLWTTVWKNKKKKKKQTQNQTRTTQSVAYPLA